MTVDSYKPRAWWTAVRKAAWCAVLSGPALCAGGAPAAAQLSTLEVVVLEDDSRSPLAGAQVRILELETAALSDDAGRVTFRNLVPQRLTVAVSRIGYVPSRATVSLEPGRPSELQVALSVRAVEIEGVGVVGRAEEAMLPRLVRTGYYDRRKFGMGTYIDPTFLERRRVLGGRLSDVLRSTPGLMLQPLMGGGFAAFSTRGRGAHSAKCPLNVFVDGMHQPPDRRPDDVAREQVEGSNVGRRIRYQRGGTDVDRVIPISDIEAVEVYSGLADTPLEFQVPPGCGAVVIWTRAGPR